MKKVFFTIIFLGIITIFFKTSVKAAIVDRSTSRQYVVYDEYLEVTETKITSINSSAYQINPGSIEAFTIFNPIEGDPSSETKLAATLQSIQVTDSSGSILEYSQEKTDSKNYIIKVEIPYVINSFQSSHITLKYNSYGLVANAGAIKDTYIPGFPEDYNFDDGTVHEEVDTKVIIPNKYPEINIISPSEEVNMINENREISIPQEDLVGQTVWIQLGTSQYFKFTIDQEMTKSSIMPLALNTYTLPLPRDIKSGSITQKVHYTKITPEPFKVELDKDGNLLATFKSPSNQNGSIHIEGYAEITQNHDFDIKNSGSLNDLTDAMKSNYLNSGEFWEVDAPEIIAAAKEIKGDSTDIYEITQKTYNYIINKIDYSQVKKYGINLRQGALMTLEGGAAVCMEYSDLFIALMRAAGVPARAGFGYGFGSTDYESLTDKTINHQWAEVYYPSQDTWIQVDTTWGEFGDAVLGGDLNHFYSHVASIDPETPSTSEVSFLGEISISPDRQMKIDLLANLAEFNSTDATTQEEILTSFGSTKSGTLNKTLTLKLKSINQLFNSVINKVFKIDKTSTQNAIKLLFVLIIILVLAVPILRHKKRSLSAN